MRYFSIIILFSILAFTSCESEESSEPIISISGTPGEVVLVATTNQWEGTIGKAFRDKFQKPIYGMPQDEPLFNVIRTSPNDFERVFKTFRNVVLIEIDTNRYSKGEVTFHKNSWAKDQLTVRIVGSSREEIISLIDAKASEIIYAIQSKEFNRLIRKYTRKSNKKAVKKLEKEMGITIAIPKAATIATSDSTHAWIRIEREKLKGGYQHQISQGIIVKKFSYTAQQQFLDSALFEARDAILRKYIPGPSDGSYMTTEYRYAPPVTNEMDFYGHFAKEIHGLWRMENDFMGGPMATFFVLNEDEGMIYCISGYAYAPQFDKREYYREIEAIARSMKFTSAS